MLILFSSSVDAADTLVAVSPASNQHRSMDRNYVQSRALTVPASRPCPSHAIAWWAFTGNLYGGGGGGINGVPTPKK